MAENSSKDMVLTPNESMFVLDQTKGHVDIFVGPTKQSLSQTDQPVVFDEKTKQFKDVVHSEAKQIMKTAPEGWYVVLKNPSKDAKPPTGSGKQTASSLDVGKKINIPGPVSFFLWPGQMAKVLRGHQLRSNQYLLCRVYDEAAARENWKKAVVKAKTEVVDPNAQQKTESEQSEAPKQIEAPEIAKASDLLMGQLLVIKGIDVSFYIPPTGVEIVPDDDGEYVREAVTLERLEYCLLTDENGNRRYERGPAVVFPEPTEIFAERVEDDQEPTRKFRAIELNENSGVYIKVIADHEDEETGESYKVGDERFITGKETMIYFPREEHAIIRYDRSEVHHGIAIPSGEARYVLDRNAGTIELVKGPRVFLPDPRTQVVVRRIIDFKLCNLLYPNNQAAFAHNAALAGVDIGTYMSEGGGLEVASAAAALMESSVQTNYLAASAMDLGRVSIGDSPQARGLRAKSSKGFSGASFDRKTKYTEPRSITLPTKFDGALDVGLYTGYAMMLVRKSGERRVVQGPQTVLFEYDETPEIMELSTGKPKTTDNLMKTVYLRVKANKVSDVVGAQTSDFCDVEMKLSYRMDFTGDPNKWFEVENYVKFMCDHLRSNLKSEVRRFTVEDFYSNSTEIIRAVILGKDGKGTTFKENGMHVYDVEVLGVVLKNQDIEKIIVESQKDVIRSSLVLASERRKLASIVESEEIQRQTAQTKAGTQTFLLDIAANVATKQLEIDLAKIGAQSRVETDRAKLRLEVEEAEVGISELTRDRMVKEATAKAETEKLAQAARIQLLEAEVSSVVERAKAVSPELAAALHSFGEKALVEKLAAHLAPMTLLGGGSLTEIVQKALAGTNLAKQLGPIVAAAAAANGGSTQARS